MPRRVKRRRRHQRGGILPLAALIPALAAAGKAAALGAAGGATNYGAKRGLKALFNRRRKRKKRAATPAEMQCLRKTLLHGNPESLIARRI